MNGNVNHPEHYSGGGIEVIEAIDAWQLNFAMGNAVKYIVRADHKGHACEDIQKAIWYLRHELVRRRKAEMKG